MKIDNAITVEVPEGIDLHGELAGASVRALAYTLDLVIRSFVLMVLSTILFFVLADAAGGFFLISMFLLEWFYPVVFEVLNKGQTPGKKIFNILVVNEDLTPIRWEASIIRNLLRAVDFLPFLNLFGLISMLISKDFKRLGDYAAGTVVIYKEEVKQHSLPDVALEYLAEPLAMEDQLAIISFTYRYKQLSPARQQELADLLVDLHGKNSQSSAAYLQGVGLGLLGKS
jgi:uncharacterized RDD family membrane protein YckC